MAGHTVLKEPYALFVIRFLFKLKGTAVLHEFFYLIRLFSAQLVQCHFNLFLLDRCILLVLATAWQSLPG